MEVNMAFSLDTKLGDLLDNDLAKSILEKHAPGITSNPMIAFAKGMTLKALLSMPQAAQFNITTARVEEVLLEINKVVK
jgi:hypothetical protein